MPGLRDMKSPISSTAAKWRRIVLSVNIYSECLGTTTTWLNWELIFLMIVSLTEFFNHCHQATRASWWTIICKGWTRLFTTKKRHIRDILGRTIYFCHAYDTSMTIIVTKPGIIIDVVGSYFYDKKSRQKMGFSSWAGRRRSCMTLFGPSMTEKTMVEARGRKI